MADAMELVPLFVLVGVLTGLLVILWHLRSKAEATVDAGDTPSTTGTTRNRIRDEGTPTGMDEQEGPRRRRGGLARMRAAADGGGARAAAVPDAVDAEETDEVSATGGDMGEGAGGSGRRKTKKEANRQAKRAAREELDARLAAQRERQEREEEARVAAREREAEAEREEAERIQRATAEREMREQEEYSQWKGLISVEDAGDDGEAEREEDPAMLERFLLYVREQKVVVLEELAAEFGLRTEDAIQRLSSLEENGTISGVFDDRGKFIYVSAEEMQRIAEYIVRRGRVSIAELAVESAKLLRLDDAAVSL